MIGVSDLINFALLFGILYYVRKMHLGFMDGFTMYPPESEPNCCGHQSKECCG